MNRWVELVSTFFGALGLMFLIAALFVWVVGSTRAVAEALIILGGFMIAGGFELWKNRPRA